MSQILHLWGGKCAFAFLGSELVVSEGLQDQYDVFNMLFHGLTEYQDVIKEH
jgi:hypothetical protein